MVSSNDDTTDDVTSHIEYDDEAPPPNRGAQPALVFTSGFESGRVYVLEGPQTLVGRAEGCQIQVLERGVSRRHLLLDLAPDGVQVIDLRSRNGVFVNGERVQRRWLKDQDVIRIAGSVTMKFAYLAEGERLFLEQLYDSAVRDSLTGLFNKRYFLGYVENNLDQLCEHGQCPALLVLDLDHFKQLNDTYGHLVGDEALKHVAQLIVAETRDGDAACRFGGEEFTVLLPSVGIDGAERIAERMRASIESRHLRVKGAPVPITVSIGVAAGREADRDPQRLIAMADARLYEAKNRGRNQVCTRTSGEEEDTVPAVGGGTAL